MDREIDIDAINPDSWQVKILPLPKGSTRGTAFGFCHGQAVGRAENARARSLGCWWPADEPEVLEFATPNADVAAGRARSESLIPGHRRGKDSALRAIAWRLKNGRLSPEDLHIASMESTWATGASGDTAVGIGAPRPSAGSYTAQVGLFWSSGSEPVVIEAPGDVTLLATDGVRLAGNVRGKATLWPTATSEPIDLSPKGMQASEIEALDGQIQIGIAWRGMAAKAGIWKNTPESFRDLTPKGFSVSRAYGGIRGLQVGLVRKKDTTRGGSEACDNRAVLWQGSAERWLDLNAMLPPELYNASTAWGIEIQGSQLRICGAAERFEASRTGTPQESHSLPVSHPVLWTAELKAAA